MNIEQLRLHHATDARALCVNEAGSFFRASSSATARLKDRHPSEADLAFLQSRGHIIAEADDLGRAAHTFGRLQRSSLGGDLDYLILVPTLRCNLSCSYCQVSRVDAS